MKINEATLRNIVRMAINEAMNERMFDYSDSGIEDYQGTGSKESKERVEKIRSKRPKYYDDDKYGTVTKSPGKSYKNKSTYLNARKTYGGVNSKDSYDVFMKFIKPLEDKIYELHKQGNEEASTRLYDLRSKFYSAYMNWAEKYKGAAEEE